MTEVASRQQGEPLLDTQDRQFMDSLRTLWRDCIDRVRGGAFPAEWEAMHVRLAELDRQLSERAS